jgi:hypothetical protein
LRKEKQPDRCAYQLQIVGNGEDVLQHVELKLVEVLFGGPPHLELPPIDALTPSRVAGA